MRIQERRLGAGDAEDRSGQVWADRDATSTYLFLSSKMLGNYDIVHMVLETRKELSSPTWFVEPYMLPLESDGSWKRIA